MKNKGVFFFAKLGAVIIFAVMAMTLQAQNYTLTMEGSSILISGTSNIHDWESEVEDIKGEFYLNGIPGSGQMERLQINIPVESIKSGKRLMDNKTYGALKSGQFPMLTFSSSEAVDFNINSSNDQIVVNGILKIAGSSKETIVKASGFFLDDDRLRFKGEMSLKMSDFEIKAPTALLGALKTGDEVLIKFDVVFTLEK